MTLTFHKYIKLLTLGTGLPLLQSQMCLIVNEPVASVFSDWFRDECNPTTRATPLLNGGSWPGCWSPSLQTKGIISLLSAPASSSRRLLLTMVSNFGHPSSPAPHIHYLNSPFGPLPVSGSSVSTSTSSVPQTAESL